MNVHSTTLVFFSPTGTTQKVVREIAAGVGAETVQVLDCTKPAVRSDDAPTFGDELVILGAPVYSGRVQPHAAHYLKRLQANGTPAVLVAVYGNRDYDDALIELRDIAADGGFVPVAGGAFIGEHSFSSDASPIAPDRPDSDDLRLAHQFGVQIREKLEQVAALEELEALSVPGNVPYKAGGSPSGITPTTTKACNLCMECVEACPTAAISREDPTQTDPQKCIACYACIKICPTGARVMENERFIEIAARLHADNPDRKEPLTFL